LHGLAYSCQTAGAEDAVQDAMVAGFTNLHRFKRRSDFRTWATRIVINAALQQIRRTRTRLVPAFDQVDDEFPGARFSEKLRDPQPSPEERLQALEHRELLEAALRNLPVEIRRAVELNKSTDHSLKEAACTLGVSVSALKARLHRGRHALIVQLKKKTQRRYDSGTSLRPIERLTAQTIPTNG